jgi:hypothetical protein
MRRLIVALTTDTSGAGTIYGPSVISKLYAIEYKPGSLATGTDLTVTCEGTGSKPLLAKTDAGTSIAWFYPRDLVHGTSDGAALTGTSGGDRALPICAGRFKIVLAQGGGATNDGQMTFYLDD